MVGGRFSSTQRERTVNHLTKIGVLLTLVLLSVGTASAGVFRHNSLFRHYGPRGVYPAHYYDYYAPPTNYGHWGLTAYQGFGVGYNHYPHPYRAYYGGYGYGPYKTAEGHPLFNNYGYAYPAQPGKNVTAPADLPIDRAPPADEDPSAQPNP